MVARFFRISHNRAVIFEPTSAIFPRHKAPVVRQASDGERELVLMSWGFMLLQNGRAPRPVTNVRDDKILTSSFWKSSFEERRCLVPASSFCEPNSDVKPATWHWFALKGGERPLFAFPGIWRNYRGPTKKDGPKEFETWLRGSAKEAFALAREYPPDRMRIVQEGFGKEDLVAVA